MRADFPVVLDGPSQISLFAYDNNTFIAESYLPTVSDVTISVLGSATKLRDLVTGQEFSPTPNDVSPTTVPARFRQQGPLRTVFSLKLNPHSYQALAIEK